MARNPNLKTTEDQTVVSGPCIVGRKTAGAGPAEELTGADAAGLLPDATSSAAGKMTAAYASKLDGISAGADATGFRGNVTDAQMLALSSPAAGQWVHNTNYGYAKYVYDGTFWLGPTDFVLTNRTGGDSVYLRNCKVSASYDFAVVNPESNAQKGIIGQIKTGGVPDGQDIVVTLASKPRKALMQANDGTVRGYFLFTYSNGESYSLVNPNTGTYGITLESKNNSSTAYEVWYVPIITELY